MVLNFNALTRLAVTFDDPGESSLYNIIYGNIGGAGGGRLGSALNGQLVTGNIPDCQYFSRIEIPIPSFQTIQTLSFYFRVGRNPPGVTLNVFILDASKNIIQVLENGDDWGINADQWYQRTYSNLSGSGGGYIFISVGIGAGGCVGLGYTQLDAVLIEGYPGGPSNSGLSDCRQDAYAGAVYGPFPINLLTGEKYEEVTDLSVNTPAGTLAFTRAFRQAKLNDSNFGFMGLGWTHTHHMVLTKTPGTPNTILVRLPHGGENHFKETTAGSNNYQVDPGSSVQLQWDGTKYILTTVNQSKYVFDSGGQVSANQWQVTAAIYPTSETWTYAYNASKQLTTVTDSYGKSLQFSYISNPGQFNDAQLWRVGDQTASGLSGSSPSGRYVEFSYIVEKLNGSTTGISNPLLATVRDVRGNVWAYIYYGQVVGESDTNQKNFLIEYRSPSLDTSGSGFTDRNLSLQKLQYTMAGTVVTGISQRRGEGAVRTDWAFQPQGQNMTIEMVAGKRTTHQFTGGLYLGSQDAAGNSRIQLQDTRYRPIVQIDANNHQTQLNWSADGKVLNRVTDALGNGTGFTYNSGGASDATLNSSVDAQGRTTVYTYGDITNPRQPTRIQVYDVDGHTILRWQEFTYDSNGRTLTETVFDPKNPTAVLQQVTREYYTSGDGNGLLRRVIQKDIGGGDDVITTYTYDSAGRVTKTQQSSNFGNCAISFTVFDAAGNVVATLCNYDPGSNSDPTTVAQALALYNRRYPDKNRVTTYEYDALGRRIKTTVDAAASFAMTTLTVYDALNRVIRTISNYVASPVVPQPYIASRSTFPHGANNDQNLVSDTVYNARGMVKRQFDVLGNVTLYGYDDAGRLVKTVQSASQGNYNNDYTDAASDPSLAHYIPGNRADQDIIATQAYDANGNLVKTTDLLGNIALTGYDPLNRPVKTVRSASQPNYDFITDPTLSRYVASSAPDQDLMDTTEYDALGRVIRTRRLLDNRPSEQWDTTLYGYDGLGRQVRVIRSASQPNYNLTVDPSLSKYPISDNTDQDIVNQTAYDASGRLLYTQDALSNRTWSAYDGLGRQVKTIVNPSGSATDNGVHDPRSPYYNPVVNVADRDLITQTTYDSDGRVLYTQDVLGRRNWPVYDSLGRTVKSVTNASGNATDGRSHDPRSPLYARSINTDQDIISQTVYDAQGRVSATLDSRGNRTQYTYDRLGRRIQTITNYVDGISKSSIPDEDRIVTTTYDLAGRVVSSRDAAGIEMRYEYDAVGRQTKTISNYVDGKFNPSVTDEDLISSTTYNRAGQVVATSDARGTQSTFTYDRAGRRLTVTQAAGTPLATVSYTCYDKAGRVVRTIQNYVTQYNSVGQLVSPDAQDERGNWIFAPTYNGLNNDTNLITRLAYDRSSRQIIVTDTLGNATLTTYFKDGQVNTLTDPEGMVTAYRYDGLRRRTRVIQSYSANGEDPARWYWNAGWKRGDGTAIAHGTNNDQNIIVDVAYDQGGRVASLRDPMGSLTTYTYDLLDRRTTLVNPINQQWLTAYFNLDFATRTVMTYPGVNGGSSYTVQRDFDRLGRLATLSYGDPATTPDVKMSYDTAGNRAKMTEYSGAGFTTPVRETQYSYDDLHRLTQAAFDTDGSGSIDESVSYAYDAGGLRTQMTLPGSLNITYAYNAKGQLIGMTDWDGQYTQFLYDAVGRHVVTQRANGLYSRYSYDASGRLRELRHHDRNKTLARFLYQVDHRGNRTQAFEELAHPATVTATIGIADAAVNYYKGTWNTSGSYKVTTQFSSAMTITFTGNETALTMGIGNDQSIFDIYIDGSLWESFDGYAAASGDRVINIYLDKGGSHIIDIRNRAEKNKNSSGYTLRFKQLLVLSTVYDQQTINYGYDALARLLTATYAGVSPSRSYGYTYDRSGNRTQQVVTVVGTPTTTNYTYNAANQLISGGATYDNNGNLTNDGVNAYSWDRANHLSSMGTTSYKYDGAGNRVQQTVGANVTKYLLDLQPGLSVVLSETTGANTTRYVHSLRGIHAIKDSSAAWHWIMQDGLGTVRSVADNMVAAQESRMYGVYGDLYSQNGSSQTSYGFTGEPTDGTGLVYLRNRYMSPTLGQFVSLDPMETPNRYGYVGGNPVNRRDPSGLCDWMVDPDTGLCIDPPVGVPPITEIPTSVPPVTGSPTQVPPIFGSGQITGQTETEEQKRKRCQEHPEHEDCEKWWDENDPNDCLCNTNYYPGSSEPFQAGVLWPTEEDDMLCNLNCYNGGIPYISYTIALKTLGVEMKLLQSAMGQRTYGAFFYPNQDVYGPSLAGIIDRDMGNVNTATRGGKIVVRQPGVNGNRASRLATLVEEIAHAAIYQGFLADCENVTERENERIAKTAKVLWIAASGIPLGLFSNPEVLLQDVTDILSHYSDAIYPFRAHCPNNTNPLPNNLVSFVQSQYGNLNCVDPRVVQTIRDVMI